MSAIRLELQVFENDRPLTSSSLLLTSEEINADPIKALTQLGWLASLHDNPEI